MSERKSAFQFGIFSLQQCVLAVSRISSIYSFGRKKIIANFLGVLEGGGGEGYRGAR